MKNFCLILLLVCCFCFVGCYSNERFPLSVTFIDVSGAMSTDHTVKISFAEEKNFEKYFIDILIKSEDDVALTLFQEFASDDDKVTLNLKAGGKYVSLDEYKLFNLEEEQTESMVGYGDALMTNLVINASKDTRITLLAVLLEKNGDDIKQMGVVSKEYTLEVKKHEKR